MSVYALQISYQSYTRLGQSTLTPAVMRCGWDRVVARLARSAREKFFTRFIGLGFWEHGKKGGFERAKGLSWLLR